MHPIPQAERRTDLRSGAFTGETQPRPGRRPALRGQCQESARWHPQMKWKRNSHPGRACTSMSGGRLHAQRPLDPAEHMRLIGLADVRGIFAILEPRVGVNDVFAMAE